MSTEFEPGDLTKDDEAIIKEAIIHLRRAVEINPSIPFQHLYFILWRKCGVLTFEFLDLS